MMAMTKWIVFCVTENVSEIERKSKQQKIVQKWGIGNGWVFDEVPSNVDEQVIYTSNIVLFITIWARAHHVEKRRVSMENGMVEINSLIIY